MSPGLSRLWGWQERKGSQCPAAHPSRGHSRRRGDSGKLGWKNVGWRAWNMEMELADLEQATAPSAKRGAHHLLCPRGQSNKRERLG